MASSKYQMFMGDMPFLAISSTAKTHRTGPSGGGKGLSMLVEVGDAVGSWVLLVIAVMGRVGIYILSAQVMISVATILLK